MDARGSGGLRARDGETPLEAATREPAEEAGGRSDTWQHLTTFYSASAHISLRSDAFLATGVVGVAGMGDSSTLVGVLLRFAHDGDGRMNILRPALARRHRTAWVAIAFDRAHHRLVWRRLAILALIVASVPQLAACDIADESASPRPAAAQTTSPEPTPDPKHLVVQLSVLPAGFAIVPGESFPTPLANVLADPSSAAHADLIERERVDGYQAQFRGPESETIECAAAVYRSSDGAREVFRRRAERLGSLLSTWLKGQWWHVRRIGEETRAYRFQIRRSKGLSVTWRYRNVLASCTTLGLRPADMRQIVGFAVAQQKRISDALR
jgi:8-oxo-dGTP pyrophosphatase MutT (NUDIX family)